MKAKRKLVPIPERTDGGGIPRDTAGCPKCDDEMPMLSDVHHSDGSVCKVMARNYAALERSGLEPMGRYSPSREWDLMIGHPECTYLTQAGARWLYVGGRGTVRDEDRWRRMHDGAKFYDALMKSGVKHICLENPVMHGHASGIVGKPTQYIQPWQFGHAETKRTGLRLVNLPKLVPTKIIPPDFEKWPPGRGNGYEPKCHFASPGVNRGKDRARTLIGIAEAMADQWGPLL